MTIDQVNSQLKAKVTATPAKTISTPTPSLKLSIEAVQARVNAALNQSQALYIAASKLNGATNLAKVVRELHFKLSGMQGLLAATAKNVERFFKA